MIDIIYKYESIIRLCVFFGGFTMLAYWEWTRPRRALTQTKIKRWFNNISLVVLSTVLMRVIIPLAAISVAYQVEQAQIGLVNQIELSIWAKVIVSLILLDLSIYFQHTLFHVIPIIWRVHRVHHSDLDCDVTTGLRFHPIEIILSFLIKIATITVLGAPVIAVILFEITLNFMSMFTHSNIYINDKIEKTLRWLLITPVLHLIHHSTRENETNSNFGFNLSIWDRLFGTYKAEPKCAISDIIIGLDQFREPKWQSIIGLLKIPFTTGVRGYAINYRDTKNADEIAMAKKIVAQNVENENLLKELNRLNQTLETKVIERTQELLTAQDKTQKAEKANSIKTAFLSNMSHELRTPLNAIIGYSELIMEDDTISLDISHKSDLDKILHAAKHLLELINEILDLSRLESGIVSLPLEAVNLDPIISETLQLIMPMAKKRNIRTRYISRSNESTIVLGNEKSTKEVLLNLLSNAVKYNSTNGDIIVTSEYVSESRIKVSVTDTGIGIAEQHQSQLFQPFNRINTSDVIEGTGIGLSISKKLVELMNGSIGMLNNAKGGSTFWFELAVYKD